MVDKNIPLSDISSIPKKAPEFDEKILEILTAQEHVFLGYTVESEPRTSEERYIPQRLIKGDIVDLKQKIEEIASRRQGLRLIKNAMISFSLGIKDKSACVWLAPLNSETGMTIGDLKDPNGDPNGDPRVIGFWDEERDEIVDSQGRVLADLGIKTRKKILDNLNSDIRKVFEDTGRNLHLREKPSVKEQEVPGSEMKG